MWQVQSISLLHHYYGTFHWRFVVKCLWTLLSISCLPSHRLLNSSKSLKDTQILTFLILLVSWHCRMSNLMSRPHRYLSSSTTAEVMKRITLQHWETKATSTFLSGKTPQIAMPACWPQQNRTHLAFMQMSWLSPPMWCASLPWIVALDCAGCPASGWSGTQRHWDSRWSQQSEWLPCTTETWLGHSACQQMSELCPASACACDKMSLAHPTVLSDEAAGPYSWHCISNGKHQDSCRTSVLAQYYRYQTFVSQNRTLGKEHSDSGLLVLHTIKACKTWEVVWQFSEKSLLTQEQRSV